MPTSDRTLIGKLARTSRAGVISSADASKALSLDSKRTGSKLASLAERGWLRRVRRGVYLIVPLEAEPGKAATAADPWILAQEVFSPCYIGGWSAAEYWELTEQIFRQRTLVDCLRNPALSGGVGHLILMMKEYANHPERDFEKLLSEAREADSGAVWKRLGYLFEMFWPEEELIVREASRKLSAGNIKLDPSVKARGKLVKRWRVWSNVDLGTHD